MFKPYSKANFKTLFTDAKTTAKTNNAQIIELETVNANPSGNHQHKLLESALDTQTYSFTYGFDKLSEESRDSVAVLRDKDGIFDPHDNFARIAKNTNDHFVKKDENANDQHNTPKYPKFDVQGHSGNNKLLQLEGDKFVVKFAKCFDIPAEFVIRVMLQAYSKLNEGGCHQDDTARLRVLISITDLDDGCIDWSCGYMKDKQDETKVMFRQSYKPGVTVSIFGDVSKRNDVWKSGPDCDRNTTNGYHRGKGTNRLVFWFEVDADEMLANGYNTLNMTPANIDKFIALLLGSQSSS